MKTALVIGASRGIGREISLTLSRNGFNVCVAAKTTDESKQLPGTIYSVSKEIQDLGGSALPVKCNVRDMTEVKNTVKTCMDKFGGIDVAVYNAGSIFWEKVCRTPLKRFDLMLDVNLRGSYSMVEELLPVYQEQKSGKFIMVSPPIYSRFFEGKTPYSISKIGVSILTQGLAKELKDTGISITSLWPATGIKSHVTDVNHIEQKLLRKATIVADACLRIAQERSGKLNGKCLIDEDFLRSEGVTDFTQYRCDPRFEPPRMMPAEFPSLKVKEEGDSFKVFSKL
ncbi:hypothetical protein LOTGIDRAFT_220526 [Lottia gigantea]|uniref:Hydroxysteroid dehydrogenase-like protein 2 n=1 Tax=Lottia gigantea TaxID=225164 RepID=V3ZQ88_LOTGI|nr:hypothetical protein LOTGIDRAFT_220526 [Lottia gigantea]ESO86497.1 hypothetical protein LOTGIDRAFT_220526 [Lottia gigantea]